jgi:hypothetical protein
MAGKSRDTNLSARNHSCHVSVVPNVTRSRRVREGRRNRSSGDSNIDRIPAAVEDQHSDITFGQLLRPDLVGRRTLHEPAGLTSILLVDLSEEGAVQ